MNENWGIYRAMLSYTESRYKLFFKIKEIQDFVSYWFQYHQVNELFKKDVLNGFME